MSGFDRSGPDEPFTPDSPKILCVTVAKYSGGELEIIFTTGELGNKAYQISREVAAALVESLVHLLV